MFDYASNNSSIYTKHFLNYNSALVEEEKKKIKSIRGGGRGKREIDLKILISVERQDFCPLRPDSADWCPVNPVSHML